jgi:hypothetical protein
VLIKRDSVADAAEKISKRRLTTFERLPTEVLAVQFDQVEGAEHGIPRNRDQVVAPGCSIASRRI